MKTLENWSIVGLLSVVSQGRKFREICNLVHPGDYTQVRAAFEATVPSREFALADAIVYMGPAKAEGHNRMDHGYALVALVR